MMATQRAGKGSSEVEKNGSVVSESSSEESAAKVRQAKKAKILKEQKQRARTRWAVVAVLLALAVIGFCYYYWWYNQETDLPQQRTRQSMPKPQREKPKSEKQKPTTAQKRKSKEQKGSKGNVKQKGAGGKGGKPKTKKGKGKSAAKEAELKRINNLKSRVLRQPLTGADPDRPHVLDIIAADNLLVAGDYREALDRFNAILSQFPQSPRALLGKGLTLVRMAKEKKSNKLMDTAIDFFRKAGLESFLSTPAVKLSALLAMVDHARDRGNLKLAIEGTEKLMELYEDNAVYANQLGILYLSQGSMKKARAQFKNNVEKFDNSYSKAQLGYILYSEKQYEQALPLIVEGIRQDDEIRMNGNFYNYAGDILVRLNRSEEAFVLYGEAVGLGVFPSVWQRSVLTEPGLTASPWWSPQDTGYMTDFTRIEKAMENITNEALALFDPEKMAFMDGTKKGAPHYLLFSKGKKSSQNCLKAHRTCALLETFPEAAGCRRGTVKFSVMPPHAHVSPHVGATNIKLHVLVALDMDREGAVRVRVAEETKVLRKGQIGVIDESFEKEVWYAGRTPALYLTIDVWHPDLSSKRQRELGVL